MSHSPSESSLDLTNSLNPVNPFDSVSYGLYKASASRSLEQASSIPQLNPIGASKLDSRDHSFVTSNWLSTAEPQSGMPRATYHLPAQQPQATDLADPLTGVSSQQPLVGNLSNSKNELQSLSANTLSANTWRLSGTLGADLFTCGSSSNYIISGNGNVDFGAGYRDQIDLSNIDSNTVCFDLVTSQGGGILYNPGNGPRVFDAMTLSNGSQILFEGIEQIQFADGVADLSVETNDPLFGQQWNLHMMGVQNAWRFTTGSERLMIGVEDTGLGTDLSQSTHADLRVDYIVPNNYQDEFGSSTSHGTAVQGIIAAESNNHIGLSGINWNSDTLQIDVLGNDFTDQSLVAATQTMIDFADQNGKQLVINMSLGTSSFNQNFHADLAQVIASNPDVLFVIAAGNSGNLGVTGLASPAVLAQYFDNVIAVGASWGRQDQYGNSTQPGQRIQYSSWGSQYGPGLTLMAPSEVITTQAENTANGTRFGYTDRFNGTSAATPNLTGVASLVWSANPDLSAGQVKQILAQTAYDLGASGYDYYYGYGFVNADAAVRQALAYDALGWDAASQAA